MIGAIKNSISRKLMLVVLVTTFAALLVSAGAMLWYDVRSYQRSWIDDLVTQADLMARTTAPALAFNDPKTAQENLALLRTRPQILSAAIYAPREELFATYSSSEAGVGGFPRFPGPPGVRIEDDQITVFHRIVENNEQIGTVYLRARYEVTERLQNQLLILGLVMACSLILATPLSAWLQAALTKPILAVTEVARDVMQRRDFSLRAEKTTSDEIGVLVDAFNGMLSEVDHRTAALEESYRILEHEMAERRSAEDALRIADRHKDEFLATLAHELRNPLAPLVSGLEILQMNSNPATARKACEIMDRQLRQMVRLVDDLLDVSRITTGKLAIRKENVELQSVVHSAVETASAFIEARKHALRVDLPQQPVYLQADPTRLAQVFSNLLNNAAKYTNPGGQIELRARCEGPQLVVEVRDNGIGISGDMQREIFKMFTQADYSLERAHAGLGVGLTLARHLVELHGGTIDVRSDGANAGSVFSVKLPIAAGPPPASPVEPIPRHPSDARFRILVVDDNVDFAGSVSALLRALGHEVQVVHDGVAALAAVAAFRPQVALLDIGLPGLNGYELASRLRAAPETSDMLLVAITGWGQEKDRQRARQAGFDRHLVKPVQLEQIQAILSQGREA
jgi:two-component system, sensor histidine kinase